MEVHGSVALVTGAAAGTGAVVNVASTAGLGFGPYASPEPPAC